MFQGYQMKTILPSNMFNQNHFPATAGSFPIHRNSSPQYVHEPLGQTPAEFHRNVPWSRDGMWYVNHTWTNYRLGIIRKAMIRHVYKNGYPLYVPSSGGSSAWLWKDLDQCIDDHLPIWVTRPTLDPVENHPQIVLDEMPIFNWHKYIYFIYWLKYWISFLLENHPQMTKRLLVYNNYSHTISVSSNPQIHSYQ